MIHMIYGWLFVNGLLVMVLTAIVTVGSAVAATRQYIYRRRHPAPPMDVETVRELDALEALWRQPPARRDVRPPS